MNGVIRKWLDVRKVSFAPQPEAVQLTGMEYGGITPIGLPAEAESPVQENLLPATAAAVGAGLLWAAGAALAFASARRKR